MTFHCQFDCYKSFLNSIGLARVLQYGLTVSILLHLVLCYVLTLRLKWGVMGVSFSTMITIFFNMLFVVIYAWRFTIHRVRPLPSRPLLYLAKNDVKIYLSISLPSIIMLMAEWIGVEMIVAIAAGLSVEAVAAMSISYSFHNVIY